jgi:hypothetical protein
MADIAGHRDNEHDPERSSEMAGQSRRSGPGAFHRRVVRTRYLIRIHPSQPTCIGLSRLLPELRNETGKTLSAVRLFATVAQIKSEQGMRGQLK